MTKRTCIYVPVEQYVEGKGYVPSVVTEGEPGHSPLTGQGEHSQPWFWGHDYKKACEIADDYNRRLGLSDQDVADILASSIAEQLRSDGRRQDLDRKLGRV